MKFCLLSASLTIFVLISLLPLGYYYNIQVKKYKKESYDHYYYYLTTFESYLRNVLIHALRMLCFNMQLNNVNYPYSLKQCLSY